MDARLLFPTAYLASYDLRGKDVTLTISGIGTAELRNADGTKKKKNVISFAEMEKRPKEEQRQLVLNKTNMRHIATHYGFDTDNWIGKKITMYATTCNAFGEVKDCIRVVPKNGRRETAGPVPK